MSSYSYRERLEQLQRMTKKKSVPKSSRKQSSLTERIEELAEENQKLKALVQQQQQHIQTLKTKIQEATKLLQS